MLIHWQSHQEYLYFLHEAKISFDSSQRLGLQSKLALSGKSYGSSILILS